MKCAVHIMMKYATHIMMDCVILSEAELSGGLPLESKSLMARRDLGEIK